MTTGLGTATQMPGCAPCAGPATVPSHSVRPSREAMGLAPWLHEEGLPLVTAMENGTSSACLSLAFKADMSTSMASPGPSLHNGSAVG